MTNVGKTRIEILKEHFGWSKSKLAVEAEVSKQAVNAWFNKGSVPGQEALIALREKHGINDQWVLGKSDQMFIEFFDDLDQETARLLREFLKSADSAERERFARMVKVFLDK